MKPKIIGTLKDSASVVYEVQTTFPSGDTQDDTRFSCYYTTAYVDKRTPKVLLIRSNPELFENNVDSRDGCVFKDYESAKVLADFIREHCHVACAYGGNEPWYKNRRKPLKARIVIVSKRETRHLVEG